MRNLSKQNQLRQTRRHTHTGYSEVIITIIRNYIIMENKTSKQKNILSIEDKNRNVQKAMVQKGNFEEEGTPGKLKALTRECAHGTA